MREFLPGRRYAVVVLPFFAAERVLPDVKVASILVSLVRGRREVMAVSAAAHARGIRIGMTATESAAILPDVNVLDHDPAGDEAGLATLARWMQRYSPRVGRWTDDTTNAASPACLWADTTGCERLFGGEWTLLARLANDMRDLGYSCRVALAGTVMAARAIALAGRAATQVVPDHTNGGGSGELTRVLASLPVHALPLQPRVLEMLADLAIVSVGQLAAIKRPSIVARFGQHTLRVLDEAHGRINDRLPVESLDEPLAIELPLPAPTDRQDALVFLLRQVINLLAGQLLGLAQGVRRLQLTLTRPTGEAEPAQIELYLTEPQRDADELFQLMRERVERVDLSVPVDGLVLVASETAGLAEEQSAMFIGGAGGGGGGDRRRELGVLVDRMRERLGDPAVLRPMLTESHIPERAAMMQQLVQAPKTVQAVLPALPPRPATLLDPPVEIRIAAAAAAGAAAGGETFDFERRTWTIGWRAGPERIVAEWWDVHGALRDYYTVHTSEGAVFWCFREPATDRWFVHGVFD